MDSNPICQPSPAKKMKCYFLDYVQLLMIGLAGWWTRTPSASPLQPKKWNATFWITFNFWWLAGLVNGLKPHPPPLSSQRNEMLIFVLCSTSNDQPGLSMDLNPIHHLSPAKKWNAHILIMFNFWWLAGLVDGLKPHPSSVKKWKSDYWPGWLMDSNPICHLIKWNAHFWNTFNFWWSAWLVCSSASGPCQKNEMLISQAFGLMFNFWWSVDSNPICQAGWWTQTPSATPLQSKNEILIFGLVQLLIISQAGQMKCHPSPALKICSFLYYVQLLMISQTGQWTQNPSATPLQPDKMKSFLDCAQLLMISQAGWWTRTPSASPLHPKKWNDHFWITFNFWWLAGLVDGLKPHPPQLFSPKNEILIFGLRSTSDDQPGWSMNSYPICHPSPAKKMKCSFLIMFNFWWSATQTPSASPLQPKKWNATFWITFNFWWLAGLVNGLKPHPPPLSSQRNEMLIFVLCSTSNDQPGLSMDLNPIHHLSPAKKWNAHILIMFNFWWLAGLVNGLKPHPPPLSSQKKWNACF